MKKHQTAFAFFSLSACWLLCIFVSGCATTNGSADPQRTSGASQPNLLVIDSSYVPVSWQGFEVVRGPCDLLNENDEKVEAAGSCFDQTQWSDLGTQDVRLLEGYLDANAKKTSANAEYWKAMKAKKDKGALGVQQGFKLLTHGSRSVLLAYSTAGERVRPFLIRSVTTQVGVKVSGESACSLRKWTPDEVKGFRSGRLRDHQQKIADVLKRYPTIRVVNFSLGYKKSWIQEDNPKCDAAAVEREYEVLYESWKNLLRKFPDRIFVAAAGNEKADFSKQENRDDDLWAKLSDQENLVLVGSLDRAGQKSSFSNFGLCQMVWEAGEEISIPYPYPNRIDGYPSAVNGTSSSAPLVSGKLVKAIEEGATPGDAIRSLRPQAKKCLQ